MDVNPKHVYLPAKKAFTQYIEAVEGSNITPKRTYVFDRHGTLETRRSVFEIIYVPNEENKKNTIQNPIRQRLGQIYES